MHDTDWYSHYQQRLGRLDFESDDLDRFYAQNSEFIDYVLQREPKRLIEAGAGLARDALVLAHRAKDVSVTLFDIDQRFLDLGEKNAKRLGLQDRLDTRQGDLLQLSSTVLSRYDICFSCGVLEHFEDAEIQTILEQELNIASTVVFTVPVRSEANLRYFKDSIYRRLLTREEWNRVLTPFSIKEVLTLRGRHEDILVTLAS